MSKITTQYFWSICMAIASLVLFRGVPELSMLLTCFILLFFVVRQLKSKVAWVLYSYPFIICFLSLFYKQTFLSLGDNVGYTGPLRDSLAFYGTAADNSVFVGNLQSIAGIQYLKLGFLPLIFVPDFLFVFTDEIIYYYFQALFYLFLVSYIFFYTKKNELLSHSDTLKFTLFLILTPSTFLLGSTPSRTFFTLFSVLLFFVSFINYQKKKDFKTLLIIGISLIFTVISKSAYIIGYVLFALLYYHKSIRSKANKYIVIIVSTAVIAYGLFYFLPKYQVYSAAGLNSFNWVLRIPVIGYLSKYVFDILSPFPHYNFLALSDEVFGGNPVVFLFHILGILTCFIIIINLVTKYVKKKYHPEPLDDMTKFGLVMSLTILPASAGFNGYISILYPLFFSFFFKKNFGGKLFFSFVTLVIINAIFFVLSVFS